MTFTKRKITIPKNLRRETFDATLNLEAYLILNWFYKVN